jgi:putative membrane protein
MILSALRLLGVIPIGAICIYRLVTLALNTKSWQILLPPNVGPHFWTLLRFRWIGESVNTLLPVAQVGGDLARASLVAARGVPRPEAAATMIADFATAIVTQMIFGLAGAVALFHLLPPGQGRHALWGEAIAGVVLVTVGVVALSILLHMGAARVASRLLAGSRAHERLGKLAGSLTRLDEAVMALLARERALAAAFAWHLVGWASQVGETWLLFWMFSAPVPFRVALAIESMSTAARGAAFFVPSGVGVQEVTILSMARLLGVDMEAAIALGIAKRARELILGVPGLLAWVIDQKWWRQRKVVGGTTNE